MNLKNLPTNNKFKDCKKYYYLKSKLEHFSVMILTKIKPKCALYGSHGNKTNDEGQ